MKYRTMITLLGSAMLVAGGIAPALASTTTTAATPTCILAWAEGFPRKSVRHMEGRFEITCTLKPIQASGAVQLEYYNPTGGSAHKGAWETAPPMPKGWNPNRINLTVGILPAHDMKVYNLASRCVARRKMREHAFGKTTEPNSTVKKFNVSFPVHPKTYC
jgi:hypothetical protein